VRELENVIHRAVVLAGGPVVHLQDVPLDVAMPETVSVLARDTVPLREALDQFERSVRAGREAIDPDYRFHLGIARATRNPHFAQIIGMLGQTIIPRAREGAGVSKAERRAYLLKVNAEHESILGAIAAEDADGARAAMRTHLANSRERRRREAAAAGNGH
jgi:DNA-binding FadR family transcriptional regulator